MFWKSLGKGLAAVGKGALKGALWASRHPEVLQAVAGAINDPRLTAVVAVVGAIESKQ